MSNLENKTLLFKVSPPLVAGVTAFILAIFKLTAGLFSGSIAVMASAIDSMLDSIISGLNYAALKKSKDKANSKFNYGLSKLEALMAFLEGLFILGVGLFIFYSSVKNIFYSQGEIKTDIAILVMVISALTTGLLVFYLHLQQKSSLIVKADILHYKSDLYTNIATILALIIIYFTGFVLIDSLFGIVVSIYIFISSIKLMKEGGNILLDRAIDKNIVENIVDFIKSRNQILSYHNLKTRQSVDKAYFSIDLVFKKDISLQNAHDEGEVLINYVKNSYPNFEWDIDIHFDPVDDSKKD